MSGIWNTDIYVKETYGNRTTLLTEVSELNGGLDKYYDRVIAMPKGASESEWISMAKAINENDKIDKIGIYGHYFQPIGAKLTKELGLKEWNPEEAIIAADNKSEMRELLANKNVENVASSLIDTFTELQQFIKLNSYPVIIKPVDGLASKGIYIIHNDLEAKESFEKFKAEYPQFKIIVEEFILGPEFSVETYSHNGKHKIITVTEKLKDEKSFVELGHIIPARISSDDNESIRAKVMKVLEALNVQNGPVHTEIILSPKGPRVVETQLRLGGDMIPRLMQLSTGYDFWKTTADQISGKEFFNDLPEVFESKQSACILYVLPKVKGKLTSLLLNNSTEMPNVDRVDLLKNWGFEFDGILESTKRCCSVIATGKDALSALDSAFTSIEAMSIEVDNKPLKIEKPF